MRLTTCLLGLENLQNVSHNPKQYNCVHKHTLDFSIGQQQQSIKKILVEQYVFLVKQEIDTLPPKCEMQIICIIPRKLLVFM